MSHRQLVILFSENINPSYLLYLFREGSLYESEDGLADFGLFKGSTLVSKFKGRDSFISASLFF